MELIIQGKKTYQYQSLPTNHGMHINHSSSLQQSGQLTTQPFSTDNASDELRKGRVGAVPAPSDYKRDPTYDYNADRLGSPKRMR